MLILTFSTSMFHDIQDWEQQLLLNIQIIDLEKLKEISLSDSFLIATDGGSSTIFKSGSFGWVIATEDAILVENGGQVLGKEPDLFRSEAYAILSILVFCQLISQLLHLIIIAIPF